MDPRGLFADTPVNTGRQNELDLGKAFPILCLPFVHSYIECTTDAGLTHGIPYLFDSVIGGPFSAPIWMFAMGVGMVYTSKRTLKGFARRGVMLIGIFYLLNICRFLTPYLTGYWISGDREQFIEPLIYRVLGNDILCFAGLAFLAITLMRWLKIPKWGMFGIALAMSVIGTAIGTVDVHNPLGNIFLGYIIGTEDATGLVISDFPILSWLIAPVCGYVFGDYLIRTKDKKKLYARVSIIPGVIAAVYLIVGIRNEWGMFGEGQNCYYHMMIWDICVCLCLNIGMLGIWHQLSKVLGTRAKSFLSEVSTGITSIYCIHWVFVRTITNVILYIKNGTQVLPVWQTLLLSFAILIVSLVISHYYRIWKTIHLGRRALNRGSESAS